MARAGESVALFVDVNFTLQQVSISLTHFKYITVIYHVVQKFDEKNIDKFD